jgi:outer membrane lipoprotein
MSIRERPDGHETYEKIPFSEILRSPEEHRGKVVRLGGVILNVANEERGTVLEILEKPLSWRGRPKPGDVSGGRFMAVFETFLDKAIYRPHRPVTITGEIVGVETAPIGEMAYEYPLLSGKGIRLWQARGYFERFRLRIGIIGSGSNVSVGVGTSF